MKLRFEHAWLGGDELEPDVVLDVEGSGITSVQIGSEGPADHEIRGVAIPGLVSAHSHAFHRALRANTHAVGGDFWSWRQPMYELAAGLTPETYEEMATLVFSEMLASGITCVGEFHYVHHRPDGSRYEDPNAMGLALVKAARRTGIRLTLLDALYLQSEVDGTPPLPEQARFSDIDSESWETRVRELAVEVADDHRIRLGISGHSIRAVSPDDLRRVATLAADLGVPAHIHGSEQTAENEACLAVYGVTPVQLMHDSGLLTPGATLVHGTHVTSEDIQLMSEAGATLCFCPTTEADLGDGIGPALEYVEADVPLALGSDSNAVIDVFEEMRRVEHHDRLRLRRRGVHSPKSLMEAGTRNGAAALGWTEAGHIAEGAVADLVVLDHRSLDLGGTKPEVVSVVMAATRAAVSDVMVDGRFVVRNGRPVDLPDAGDIAAAWDRLVG